MPEIVYYVSKSHPKCPICNWDARLLEKSGRFLGCINHQCAVYGFETLDDKRFEDATKLIFVWLGKLPVKRAITEVPKEITLDDLDLEYGSEKWWAEKKQILLEKTLPEWNQRYREFLKREKKTAIELRALRKLKDWDSAQRIDLL